MATNAARTESYLARPEQALEALCATIVAEKMTIVAVDPALGHVQFKRSMTVWSWGERLTAQIRQTGPETVLISIRSELNFGLVDWGKNAKNVARLFSRLSTLLPPGVAAPLLGWHPDPTGRNQLRWWDGATWTAVVSNGGQQSNDPIS